jgi:hypothetical protein
MARKPLSERNRSIKRLGNLAMAMAASAIAAECLEPVELKGRAITTKGRRPAGFQVHAVRDCEAFIKAYTQHVRSYGEACLDDAIEQAVRQNPLIGKPRASLLQLIEDQCRTLEYSHGYEMSEYKQSLYAKLSDLLAVIESTYLTPQGVARRSIEKLHLALKQARSNGGDIESIQAQIDQIDTAWTGTVPLNDPYTDYFSDLDAVIDLLASSQIRQGVVALNKYLFSRMRHAVMSYDQDRKRQILDIIIRDVLGSYDHTSIDVAHLAA